MPQTAMSSPSVPPTAASSTLSVSSWRTSAHASGAERAPDRHLALPHRRAREQQVRDVRAGDEQDEADRGEQRQQRRTHVADQVVVQRDDAQRPSGGRGIVGRVLRPQRRRRAHRHAAAQRRRHAGLHAGRCRRSDVRAPDRLLRERRRDPPGRRQTSTSVSVPRPGWRNDDGATPMIEYMSLSMRIRFRARSAAAEAPLPQRVADDRDFRDARLRIRGHRRRGRSSAPMPSIAK